MQTYPQPFWFGRYRLSSRIATGGMAEVFAGRHVSENGQFGPMVAVKRLLPHFINDEAVVRMFLNEARITAQIRHPNVVQIFELGQVDGEPFMAMELLEGHTLDEVRLTAAKAGQRVPTEVAMRIFIDACLGLDMAHRAVDDTGASLALVHRDFTPDNIHVGIDGQVKVIDFGVARTQNWTSGTEPGILKGKFFYMSPEMVLAQPVDHRADLFAAGVMLYEQLCGSRPFGGQTIDEVVKKIASFEPPTPRSLNPGVPEALEAVCLKALQKRPENRFASLFEFVQALQHAGGGLATAKAVAGYMVGLFPESSDPKRTTLRVARELDASASAEAKEASAARASAPEVIEVVPVGQESEARAPKSKTPAKLPTKPGVVKSAKTSHWRRNVARALMGVTAIVLLAGAVKFYLARAQPLDLATLRVMPDSAARLKALQSWSQQPERTANELKEAAAMLPDDAEATTRLAFAENWIRSDSNAIEAHLMAGKAALELKRGKRVEQAAREASVAAPNDGRPYALLAEYREMTGDVNAATEAWAQAARRSARDASILRRQGMWLSQLARLDDAAVALEKSVSLKFDARTAAELGFVRYRQERFVDALKLVQRAIKAQPTLMEGHYYLGTVLYQRGDIDKARAAYTKAVTLSPTDSRPLLAWCQLEAQQKTPKAESLKQEFEVKFKDKAAELKRQCEASVAASE
jgi:eukaryotic-like serine/threonine-protein kinase